MILKNKTYDILKWVDLLFLPALATVWLAVSGIWHLPFQSEILGTIAAIETFIGSLIGISNRNYYEIQGQTTFEVEDNETEDYESRQSK